MQARPFIQTRITFFHLRHELKSWRRKLRLSVQLGLKLRSRELISPGNLRRSVRGSRKLEVPLLLRLR